MRRHFIPASHETPVTITPSNESQGRRPERSAARRPRGVAAALALGLIAELTVIMTGLGTLAAAPASAATRIIPVPTSSAGLGRIVTAPNGNMWFIETEANKLARLTPDGKITEIQLYAQFDSTVAKDVAVSPDGTVWVLYNSGRYVAGVNDAGQVTRGPYDLTVYGQKIRIARDGTPWITATDAGDGFIVRIVRNSLQSSANSPDCGDALGLGRDGAFWCRTDSGLTRLNANASGGVTYPANRYAAYPYTIAAGPTGSVWFGRYFSGTYATSPDDGEVGYINANTGRVTAFNTGSRTAPNSMVQGPDGNMWFTSIGAAAGIGHITPDGRRGSLHKIGGYEPNALTFAKNGLIYATDSTNNVIVRVSPTQLLTTNTNPGDGSVLYGTAPGTIKTTKRPVKIARGAVPVRITCPKSARRTCTAKLRITTAKKSARPISKTTRYKVKSGRSKTINVKLTKKGQRAIPRRKNTKVRVQVIAGNKIATTKTIRVRR